ncbi:glycosyl transferase family 90 [Sphingobacterium sp. WOUb80]|uniref:glycosyl transferase family 90 n=1 Tax=Sphingobacterium sp. WOUb80 TaxID=3234028 RepID=UPI003CF49238
MNLNFKKIFLKNKNVKFFYYLSVFGRQLRPKLLLRKKASVLLNKNQTEESEWVRFRINYYNKLSPQQPLSDQAIQIKDYKMPEKIRVYYFDSKEYLDYFDQQLKFQILPGDIIDIPDKPALVKSRPIAGDNANSVLLNLDKSRHFNFITDHVAFQKKKNALVGRSEFAQVHRELFFQKYHKHPLCDLKRAFKSSDPDYLSITGHLSYKFILALEGNDVATNLKWIMSSNSIAVMPMPKYETWFMEGSLIPDHHFICIKEDYSDLEEKLNYFINHEDAAKCIVKNAHEYVAQFKNKKLEDLISLRVLQKYFISTGQSVNL